MEDNLRKIKDQLTRSTTYLEYIDCSSDNFLILLSGYRFESSLAKETPREGKMFDGNEE